MDNSLPMNLELGRRIEAIRPLPNHRLFVRWTNGGEAVVDLADDIANGPVFRPLRDERLFAQVELSDDGRVIAWPEPRNEFGPLIDIDADGLWFTAQEQRRAVAAE